MSGAANPEGGRLKRYVVVQEVRYRTVYTVEAVDKMDAINVVEIAHGECMIHPVATAKARAAILAEDAELPEIRRHAFDSAPGEGAKRR